jgi:methionyl aminopeptidase
MTIRTEQDIIGMKQASEAAAKTLRLMNILRTGMTTRDVDQYGGEIIKSCGARSPYWLTDSQDSPVLASMKLRLMEFHLPIKS